MSRMNSTLKSLPRWAIPAATAAAALLAWGLFRPDFRPDAQTLSPTVREGLARTGFQSTQEIVSAKFKTVEEDDWGSTDWDSRHEIAPFDSLISQKWIQRDTKGLTQEVSGLYAGPIAVMRFTRNPPPIFGALLPNHFWMSSRLSAFSVEEKIDFPHTVGGRLLAKFAYEEHFAEGALNQTERGSLRCDVAKIVNAESINSRLSGMAARLDCKESLEIFQGSPGVGTNAIRSSRSGHLTYSHWYMLNRGWSIPIEGQYTVSYGEITSPRKWTAKLLAFNVSRADGSK